MIDPIGNLVTDPVTRLRDLGILLQQPERDLIADEIERLRDEARKSLEALDRYYAEIERLRAVLKRHHRRCMDWMREEYTESQLYDDTKAALADEQPSGETDK